ncbi:MAG: glycosyltransferase family protein, partial [Prevotellaceae bacterium]|nr:glycosyltransferase family protein [Prevotellaceae bacterium]
DDITFKSQNWGQIIENHFADSSIGMIGVAGSHYMPDIPFYWATPFVSVHNLNKGINGVEEWFYTDFFGKKTLIDCVTLDGLCYFIRKSLFDSISYDEKSYSGFHFYDMDISMQVLTSNYRVCVCRDLLLEHQWFHNMNKAGMELFEINKNIFFNKWKNHFPITRGIDAIPKLTIERVTQLYQDIYKLSQVKKTHAYKLGYAILYPYKLLKRIINKL